MPNSAILLILRLKQIAYVTAN